ncbi:MAG: hypothetical protein ABI183_15970 [Polyangiaceae bacterium]
MSSIGIVLNTSCPRCHENFPVNAIANLRCPKCAQVVPVDAATWKQVLESPALDGPLAEPGRDHVAPVQAAIPFIRNFVRKDAACARCNAALPLPQALAHAQRGWCICVNCGDKVSVRLLPPVFAGLGGVTHVIGEDFAALNDDGAQHAPVMASTSEIVSCPACGGNLPVDGSSQRAIPCRHCRSQIVIAEAIWAKLHPLPLQRSFYLWSTATAVVQNADKVDMSWNSLCDVVTDDRGNLYFLGFRGGDSFNDNLSLWSTDAQFHLRWLREKIPIKENQDDSHMVMTPSGYLLVWCESRHGAIVISGNDGSTAATLGGVEPPNSQAHFFDLEFLEDLTIAPDGAIIGLLHHRLLRWTHDGQPLETWPLGKGLFGGEKHQKLRPLFSGDGDKRHRVVAEAEHPSSIEELKDRPIELYTDYTSCKSGRDGSLYLWRSANVARLDAQGKIIFKAKLPEEHGNEYGSPCIDASGASYFLVSMRGSSHGIFRISPNGRDVRLIVDGSSVGTPMGSDRNLLVLPDGTMMTFGHDSVLRVFAPDGSVRFLSEKAREDDADRARKKAERDE